MTVFMTIPPVQILTDRTTVLVGLDTWEMAKQAANSQVVNISIYMYHGFNKLQIGVKRQ